MENCQLNWNEGDHSGLVSIGTHSMFLSAAGPTRSSPSTPAVILEAGGGSNSIPYAAVKRLISKFARVYSYDRSGRGRSEISPSRDVKLDATTLAIELSSLLAAAKIPPPYVMVPHSYGGIISREFLAMKGTEEVVGIVLVDTNHEDMHKEKIFPFDLMGILTEGVDEDKTLGLEKTNKLNEDEWKAFIEDKSGDPETLKQEIRWNPSGHTALREKKQLENQALGDRPLSIIKGDITSDFKALVEAGVKRGNGTEEQREEMGRILKGLSTVAERIMRDQLRLSMKTRFVYAEKSGHNIHLTEPGVIAEEVRWMLDELMS
jgi:pimeloyl-ACP methyl ester carboxylesterase